MFDNRSTVDDMLRRIHSELDQLPHLVQMLDSEPAEVRDVWHWQWDDLIGGVGYLSQCHRSGQMSTVQEQEFLVIARLLSECQSSVEALGCHIPPDMGQAMSIEG